MTSRRSMATWDARLSRALQFVPGHVGGRVASAQPVTRPRSIGYRGTRTYGWTHHTSGVADDMIELAAGGGWYVATTNDTHLVYAANPAGSWSTSGTLTQNTDVIGYGNGQFVSTLNTNRIAVASSPGGSWTEYTNLQGIFTSTGYRITVVQYGGGVWVAGGNNGTNGKVATATDPAGTWTENTSMTTILGTANVITIRYVGGYWVALATAQKWAYATDPTGTWTSGGTVPMAFWANDVSYGAGTWVIVGASGGTNAYSTDLSSGWTSGTAIAATCAHLEYGNGVWVAANSSGDFYTSTDPTGSWSSAVESGFGADNIEDLDFVSGLWVAVGGSGKVAVATDPTIGAA